MKHLPHMFIETGSVSVLFEYATILANRNVGMFKEVQSRNATLESNIGIWYKYCFWTLSTVLKKPHLTNISTIWNLSSGDQQINQVNSAL
jgi:hypothetical protein